MNIVYEIGAYGPVILLFISWYLLWDNNNLFFYYTVGVFVNSILNLILKSIIQDPRPIFDKKNIKLASTHTKDQFYATGIPFDIFGMPSGHAQSSLFSTIFIYLSLNHKNIMYLYLFISLISCYQRVSFNYHSILQIIVGAIIGAWFGYFVYQLAREKIKGKIREKPDDNAPI
jgi:membrane-associated phospholipid phosphatase